MIVSKRLAPRRGDSHREVGAWARLSTLEASMYYCGIDAHVKYLRIAVLEVVPLGRRLQQLRRVPGTHLLGAVPIHPFPDPPGEGPLTAVKRRGGERIRSSDRMVSPLEGRRPDKGALGHRMIASELPDGALSAALHAVSGEGHSDRGVDR